MGKRHDIDKAVRNIKKWADRSEWSDELSIVFDAHFATVRENVDISHEALHQYIAESDYGGMLFGVMFEDFLSRRLSPRNNNIIDDYLARSGWRESVVGLLSKLRKQFDKKHSGKRKKGAKTNLLSSENPDDVFLRDACPALSSIWLVHILEQLQRPSPAMATRDGDPLVFSETRFPFLPEKAEEIAARMDAATEWVRDAPQKDAWIWLPEPSTNAEGPRDGLAFNTSLEGQRPISGTLELTPGTLTLLTNSMERAKRGTDVLQESSG